ncbi:ComF family protein [Marinomonas foliarum]|uniref:ComF family protein n=1 Tax=Marinomonas foliarum TaxID=491950 RepID=A0A369AKP8_9GAMM|nr:ComF family protein [Marinomonas foliarum]RCX08856.1 ComF family protein [Marinomonas foliarum]
MDWKKLSTTKITEVYRGLFFNQCYICHAKAKNTLCQHCKQGLPTNHTHCHQCKRPTHTHNILCGQCQSNPPAYQVCVAPYQFEGVIKTLIHGIKFNQRNQYIRPLTFLLSEQLIESYLDQSWPEQLLYVPSHPSRIKERGFCQTKAMATQLTRELKQHLGDKCPNLPKKNPIKKIKNTQAQHSLSRKERLKSPKNSYLITPPTAKHIALFDDVMTTGSTIEHCTKLLLAAGVEQVDIWVIARTPDKEYKPQAKQTV